MAGAVVIGAGPGIGRSVARRFAREGLPITLIARTEATLATVTVDGPVAKGTPFDPDDIAEHYWRLHTQTREGWAREIVRKG
jgi:NAD(P)-dependent dehydrogenase (short-subunit alcohol dehydrogenase family)